MEYILQEGLLFKGYQLCIPRCSIRENLLKEKHSGGLARHFGQDKTFAQLKDFYSWPGMQTDVKIFVEKCKICQYAKGEVRTQVYISHYQSSRFGQRATGPGQSVKGLRRWVRARS
jgi:hypothetical protein